MQVGGIIFPITFDSSALPGKFGRTNIGIFFRIPYDFNILNIKGSFEKSINFFTMRESVFLSCEYEGAAF